MNIALVVVAYNRVKSLERLLSSLKHAHYGANNVTLIISIDKSDTTAVSDYANNFEWPHGDKIVKAWEENQGLRKHMLSLGNYFDCFDALVVLEDDIIVSPYFYSFVNATVTKYFDNPLIAGISLYNFPVNPYSQLLFEPVVTKYDVFLMNTAQSWGQIWMKNQWKDFYAWYLENTDFKYSDRIPEPLFQWRKSWLKYHTRYCIERNKYFVYPYSAYSSNCGDAGTHAQQKNYAFQSILRMGAFKNYVLPESEDDYICYDGFFESKQIYKALNTSENDLLLDLNGMHKSSCGKRFWLTTSKLDFKIVKTFGLELRPIELNVTENIQGNEIFLYDTTIIITNTLKGEFSLVKYNRRVLSVIGFVKKYGIKRIFKDLLMRLALR